MFNNAQALIELNSSEYLDQVYDVLIRVVDRDAARVIIDYLEVGNRILISGARALTRRHFPDHNGDVHVQVNVRRSGDYAENVSYVAVCIPYMKRVLHGVDAWMFADTYSLLDGRVNVYYKGQQTPAQSER